MSRQTRLLVRSALAAWIVLCGSEAWAQAPRSCHPDGKPTEPEVIFFSSGGTYAEAITKAYFEPFEKECGIKVRQVTGARSYAQLRLLVRSGNLAWDMGGTIADQEMPLGIRDGIYHKLPPGFWDGMKGGMLPGSYNDYAAWATPYSIVLVYSKSAFPGGMRSWVDFWDVQRFPGPRIMANSPFMLLLALMADGVAPDKLYPLDLDRAFRKMDQLRPNIRAFYSSADQGVQGVANGEFVAGTTFSGRAAAALQAGKPIGVSWNDQVLHMSWNFILKGTPHPRAAEALMAFMQRPDRQAELARLTGYSGGSRDVVPLLSPEVVALLPSSPEHLASSAPVDAEWWADNNAKVAARWDAWMAAR